MMDATRRIISSGTSKVSAARAKSSSESPETGPPESSETSKGAAPAIAVSVSARAFSGVASAASSRMSAATETTSARPGPTGGVVLALPGRRRATTTMPSTSLSEHEPGSSSELAPGLHRRATTTMPPTSVSEHEPESSSRLAGEPRASPPPGYTEPRGSASGGRAGGLALLWLRVCIPDADDVCFEPESVSRRRRRLLDTRPEFA
mmetsp:Transcript_17891/g.53228  ORF Transcript_17891/g.53228 Transcript_17891/m.53228 type:complete len:206 (+) Transcript_17891:448-1065(+)